MAHYYTWLRNCDTTTGVFKVVTKPRHGTITANLVDWKIGASRVKGVDRCFGKPIKAFRVDYISEPGFHGTDTFMIDVFFGATKRREIDTFSVTVR